jgi:1-aminocyclopropane-1-carboxylate deaminase/D-cysteine desulfhydrase-like pyridoxal-dependent ACC family enzyme
MDLDQNTTENTDSVDDIISQLREFPTVVRKSEELSEVMDKNKVQDFVIEYSTRLIKSATESVEYVKDIVQAAPTPDDVEALASLIGSTSTALDILNKMAISDKKIDTTVKLKQMDIDTKQKQLETKVATTMLLTREEVMKQLIEQSNKIKKPKIIEI